MTSPVHPRTQPHIHTHTPTLSPSQHNIFEMHGAFRRCRAYAITATCIARGNGYTDRWQYQRAHIVIHPHPHTHTLSSCTCSPPRHAHCLGGCTRCSLQYKHNIFETCAEDCCCAGTVVVVVVHTHNRCRSNASGLSLRMSKFASAEIWSAVVMFAVIRVRYIG